MSGILLKVRTQVQVTDDDKSPLLGICSILLAIVALTGFLGRVFTKLTVLKKLFADDFTMMAALILAIAQSVLIVVAANSGLGKRTSALTDAQLNLLDELTFAAGLLFIATMALAKISAAMFIRNIVLSIMELERLAHAYCVLIALWGVASLFGAAFTRRGPWLLQAHTHPGQELAFWYSFDALNIITDFLLTVWPIHLFRSLRMNLKKRSLVLFCFVARILTVAATIVQMIYLKDTQSQPDRAFAVWPLVLCTEAVQALSITTGCIPSLIPFLRSDSSGMLRSDNFRRRGLEGTYYGYDSKAGSRKASAAASSLAARAGSESRLINPLSLFFRGDRENYRFGRTLRPESAPRTTLPSGSGAV